MRPDADWRALMVCDSLAEAESIATAIASMEFDVRLRHLRSGEPITGEEPADTRCLVEVLEEEWDALHPYLDDIAGEQRDFDDRLAERDRAVGRTRRGVLLALGVIVGVLALLRLIDL